MTKVRVYHADAVDILLLMGISAAKSYNAERLQRSFPKLVLDLYENYEDALSERPNLSQLVQDVVSVDAANVEIVFGARPELKVEGTPGPEQPDVPEPVKSSAVVAAALATKLPAIVAAIAPPRKSEPVTKSVTLSPVASEFTAMGDFQPVKSEPAKAMKPAQEALYDPPEPAPLMPTTPVPPRTVQIQSPAPDTPSKTGGRAPGMAVPTRRPGRPPGAKNKAKVANGIPKDHLLPLMRAVHDLLVVVTNAIKDNGDAVNED